MTRIKPRLWIPLFGIFFVFLLIALRLGQLQLALHKPLKEKMLKEVVRSEKRRPLRGRILDRRGRVIALSVERPSIAVSLAETALSRTALASKLARVLTDVSESELNRRLKGPPRFVWIKRLASIKEGSQVQKLNLTGVQVIPEAKRLYPYGEVASGLLGNVGIDGNGTRGLEYGLESILHGEEVVHIVLRDAFGKVFAEQLSSKFLSKDSNEENKKEAVQALDVYVTLDMELQSHLEKHLAQSMDLHEPKMAMAVVEDIKTGSILAMASQTNPKAFENFSKVDPNSVVSFTFEPGSVIKPLVMAAALEANAVKESDSIDCENGQFYLAPGRVIRDHEPYRILTVPEVLAYSSNIGMVKIARELGSQALYNSFRMFGLGGKTTLPITGEAVGILKPPESWMPQVTVGMMSFGYEIGVTLLQLAAAFSALANDGVLLEPQIIDAVKGPRDNTVSIYQMKPRRIRQAVPAKIAQRSLALMEHVVRYGTGTKAQIPGYPVAGKTGTAQKIDPKTGKHSPTKVLVTFCGVVPLPEPRLAICTALDEPTKPKVAWASDIAAPLFSGIAQDAINLLAIPPQVLVDTVTISYRAWKPSLVQMQGAPERIDLKKSVSEDERVR